jgi:hypothetical protein
MLTLCTVHSLLASHMASQKQSLRAPLLLPFTSSCIETTNGERSAGGLSSTCALSSKYNPCSCRVAQAPVPEHAVLESQQQ